MGAFRCQACGQFNRVPTGAAAGRTPVCGRCKKRLDTSGAPQDVDFSNMQAVIANAPVPVVVDVWAPWCGPCRMAAPILADIARKRAGEVLVLKVNSDENPAVGATYGIRGIPTFLGFRDGREVARQAGVMPAQRFEQWVAAIAPA